MIKEFHQIELVLKPQKRAMPDNTERKPMTIDEMVKSDSKGQNKQLTATELFLNSLILAQEGRVNLY